MTLSDLPLELWEEIMKSLCWADQIRMRAACKSWQQLPIQDDGFLHRLPWVATFNCPKKDDFVCNVYDPIKLMKPYVTHKFSRDDSLRFDGSVLIPCKQGWVLFLKEKYDTGIIELLLLHPITKQIVFLPDLHLGIRTMKRVHSSSSMLRNFAFAFSSRPDSQGCIFFLLCFDWKGKAISSTYKQKDEKGWITKRFKRVKPPRTNSVYYQGDFCHASMDGSLTCYRVADHKWYWLKNKARFPPYSNFYETRLIVSPSDELLLVRYNSLGSRFCLFTFDWTKMRWIIISHLNDQVLFLAQNPWCYSFAVPTFGFESTTEFANKIIIYKDSHINSRILEGRESDYLSVINERDDNNIVVWIENS